MFVLNFKMKILLGLWETADSDWRPKKTFWYWERDPVLVPVKVNRKKHHNTSTCSI